ncbi:MAG: Gfo/Idh/MocA family protein, partial [Solirubrobacteraceae bacterium]
MSTNLRVGIVGAGYIAGLHSAAYQCLAGTFPEAEVTIDLRRVADSAGERAAALGRGWGWSEQHDDWRAVTRADDIDLVDICVPNALHAEIALDAFAHGKHVVCEKPLAADLLSAREMQAAAAESGTLSQVC